VPTGGSAIYLSINDPDRYAIFWSSLQDFNPGHRRGLLVAGYGIADGWQGLISPANCAALKLVTRNRVGWREGDVAGLNGEFIFPDTDRAGVIVLVECDGRVPVDAGAELRAHGETAPGTDFQCSGRVEADRITSCCPSRIDFAFSFHDE